MSSRVPRPWEIRVNLALIAALREVDTEGAHTALCDAEELTWRRIAMNGDTDPNATIYAGVTPRSAIELTRLAPEKYFEVARANGASSLALMAPPLRRSIPSTDEERPTTGKVTDSTRRWRRRWRQHGQKGVDS